MNDFNDKLLDASLKEYSRVSPPDGFVVRQPEPRSERTHWIKLFAPVAATAVVIALISTHTDRPVRSRPRPVPPTRTVINVQAAPLPQTLDLRPLRKLPKIEAAAPAAEGSRFHTLTSIEIAKLDLPAELFEPRVEQPITDLQITELAVTPIEITDSMPKPKE